MFQIIKRRPSQESNDRNKLQIQFCFSAVRTKSPMSKKKKKGTFFIERSAKLQIGKNQQQDGDPTEHPLLHPRRLLFQPLSLPKQLLRLDREIQK